MLIIAPNLGRAGDSIRHSQNVGSNAFIQREPLSFLAGEMRMAHLDCIRKFTRQLAELMLQFGQILRTKTRTQLQHQWPKPIRERRHP